MELVGCRSRPGILRSQDMQIPQMLTDIVRLLLQLAPVMALVALVLAGISLRFERGSTFLIGGGFTQWMLWSAVLMTLTLLLMWFSFFRLPIPPTTGPIGTDWLDTIGIDVADFVNSFIVNRVSVTLAAYFVLRAILDGTNGGQPLPSILTAMFLLAIP